MGRRMLHVSLVLAMASAWALAGCSRAAAGASEVVVTESVFNITLTPDHVPAGKVTFAVSNPSLMRHEFLVISSNRTPADLPLWPNGRVNEDVVDIIDTIEDVPPHGSGNLTLDLEPGRYVLICNLPEHYGHGMHAELVVTDGGSLPTLVPTGAPTPTPGSSATVTPIPSGASPSASPSASASAAASGGAS